MPEQLANAHGQVFKVGGQTYTRTMSIGSSTVRVTGAGYLPECPKTTTACAAPCGIKVAPSSSAYDCDCTGRHTFDIEVAWQTEVDAYESDTFRVHVIDVLEIASGHDAEYRPMIWLSSEGVAWLMVEGEPSIITLPPDAAPGMWLVRLAVHRDR